VKFKVKQDYAELRRNDYPDIRDQLDALWKGGEALEAMRQQVLEVKARYPKQARKPDAQG
jgi:hypothetical protein